MIHKQLSVLLLPLLVLLTSCTESETTSAVEENELSDEELNFTPESQALSASSDNFETIEWDALIPADDLEALLSPPEYLDDIVDGSLEDSLERKIEGAFDPSTDPYQQALVSTKVITEMNGKRVKIPGFIVPIETNEDKLVTEFFIVPYFGACLHMPPPPPNQIIYATYPQGVEQPTLYEPFWLSGELKTEITTNDIAQSAYEMRIASYELYTD